MPRAVTARNCRLPNAGDVSATRKSGRPLKENSSKRLRNAADRAIFPRAMQISEIDMNAMKVTSVLVAATLLTACVDRRAADYVATPPAYVQGTYVSPAVQGPVAGTGIEGQDIDAMVDKMARDLLATATVAGRSVAPRIILDDSDFINKGSQALDKSMITDSLRVKLNRAAQGRMLFLDRAHMATIERERELKRSGATDVGTTGMTRAVAGADFKLVGAIHVLNAKKLGNGMVQRTTQITFELTDLESGVLVWSNDYAFAKAGADDIAYQ
jgi:PBP1b-binding outer membrane lipoprotein LpoB